MQALKTRCKQLPWCTRRILDLLSTYRAQRDATLGVLARMTAQELAQETGIEYAPTKGALISLMGEHWLMHCGQWVIVRRENGKPIVI